MDLHVHFRRGGKSNNKGSNGNQLTKTEGEKNGYQPNYKCAAPNHIPAKRFGVRCTSSDELAMEKDEYQS